MNQKTFHSFLQKTVALLFICVVAIFSLSSYSSQKMTDDVWKMLGITKQAGSEKIKNSFINGYLDHYGMRNLKNITSNNRAAIAKDLLTYTKNYISSPAFIRQYEEMRKQAKPQESVLKPLRTIEQIQKEEIAKTEKSIKETEKNMKEMPQFAKSMEPVLDMLKKNIKDYQDPKNKYFSSIAMGEKYDQENEIKRFKERTQYWETAYPASLNQFLAIRLQKMLDATKDIDYNAELVEKYNKKRFVNPAYESKNTEWKQGFRAGKEVTEPARAFAQKWLNELQTKL